MKKAARTIVLSATDVEKIIRDLSLVIVSMDRIGSTYYNSPKALALETDKFMRKARAFKLLAQARRLLTEAYNGQSSDADVARSEEKAEALPYWEPKRKRNSRTH